MAKNVNKTQLSNRNHYRRLRQTQTGVCDGKGQTQRTHHRFVMVCYIYIYTTTEPRAFAIYYGFGLNSLGDRGGHNIIIILDLRAHVDGQRHPLQHCVLIVD